MSLHLSTTVVPDASDSDSDHSSSNDDEDDQNWDEWVSDSLLSKTLSLFENKQFVSVAEALEYDKLAHGFDLNDICSRLSLDFHQRIRLINFIRKNKPPATSVTSLTGSEAFLSLDEYLIPAIDDDPLLQVHVDDWSDSDSDEASPEDAPVTDHHVQSLKNKLAAAKQDLVDYRALVHKQFNEVIKEPDSSQQVSTSRDDDSHYFSSYAENDIHAVMIQDKVRTSTYASFILTNPSIFRDAIVLDVGCGTGILSLFAARGGAKRVIAVDASDIAEKAEKIVKANGLDDVITVIRGKVEEITLPDGITHVDIIISEWMGYALLYESMLDSVLRARDRFLRPQGGVMAPSQCRMMLGLCEGSAIYKERIGFWNDVYGFDMSTMADDLYDEAIVDIVGPETMVSEPQIIKDLHLGAITARQLDFSSSFNLISTAERRTKVHSFILYFDTFFTVTGDPVPPDTAAHMLKNGDLALVEVWPVGGKSSLQRRRSSARKKDQITSFSTGPKSVPTHWKQTLFLLREPIIVEEGTIVSGTFRCRKSEINSRELQVEIHYSVRDSADALPNDVVVEMYTVR